jgi:hypothetical protein
MEAGAEEAEALLAHEVELPVRMTTAAKPPLAPKRAKAQPKPQPNPRSDQPVWRLWTKRAIYFSCLVAVLALGSSLHGTRTERTIIHGVRALPAKARDVIKRGEASLRNHTRRTHHHHLEPNSTQVAQNASHGPRRRRPRRLTETPSFPPVSAHTHKPYHVSCGGGGSTRCAGCLVRCARVTICLYGLSCVFLSFILKLGLGEMAAQQQRAELQCEGVGAWCAGHDADTVRSAQRHAGVSAHPEDGRLLFQLATCLLAEGWNRLQVRSPTRRIAYGVCSWRRREVC